MSTELSAFFERVRAAYLAAAAAYRLGAGLVTLAVPLPIYPILAAQLPEQRGEGGKLRLCNFSSTSWSMKFRCLA